MINFGVTVVPKGKSRLEKTTKNSAEFFSSSRFW